MAHQVQDGVALALERGVESLRCAAAKPPGQAQALKQRGLALEEGSQVLLTSRAG